MTLSRWVSVLCHAIGVRQENVFFVSEVKGENVICVINITATLDGTIFTLHASQVHIDMPTLSEKDLICIIINRNV